MGSEAPVPPLDRQQGAAAEAIAAAEIALAHQNSASSQLDLQVVSAILNAHLKTVEGREALNKLQEDTEEALRTRSDLDTPAGARDFQRFLISKLRDIRAVVAGASLDDTSKSALMAAWTALYNASGSTNETTGDRPAAASAPAGGGTQRPAPSSIGAGDPDLDSLLLDDPGLLGMEPPAQPPASAAPPSALAPPSVPGLGAMPALGSLPSLGAGESPLSGRLGDGRTEREPDRLAAAFRDNEDGGPRESSDDADDYQRDREADDSTDPARSTPVGPTTVTLPDGETVTAASPELAAAIKDAASGTPIADAFREHGMTIPPPGTAVASPIEPSRLVPGDIGMFTDRHALALGNDKAVLDGQIQQIGAVSGPSFLGWEHPPTPAVATAPPATPGPTPTRPAMVSVKPQ